MSSEGFSSKSLPTLEDTIPLYVSDIASGENSLALQASNIDDMLTYFRSLEIQEKGMNVHILTKSLHDFQKFFLLLHEDEVLTIYFDDKHEPIGIAYMFAEDDCCFDIYTISHHLDLATISLYAKNIQNPDIFFPEKRSTFTYRNNED